MKKIQKVKEDVKNKVQKQIKKHGKRNFLLSILMIFLISIASLTLIFALYIILTSPDFNKDLLYAKEATIIYDINNEEMARIGSANRTLVSYDELPQVLIDALVATEDSRFFEHNGVDGARFIKASFGQMLGSSSAGGASTLTMQVVKNTYTGKEASGLKGIIRKFKDIYMAVFKVENAYTKEEIIEFYVNSQWFNGGNLNYASISGIEEACEYYFGKSVSDITLAEASLMAGMFQNPVYYNPYTFPDHATKRQETVLSLMVRHGYITEEEKEAVQKIDIQTLLKEQDNSAANNMYQADIDYIVQEVADKTGLNAYKTPLKIYSTIDPEVQKVLHSLEQGDIYKWPNDHLQEGIAVTSVENGSIVALSGGRDYQAKGTNRATDICRQPGSTAKPIFDYGPYIEYLNGSTYSPFLDEPTTYSNGTPIKNADGSYYGLITMRTALMNSRNVPALRAFKQIEKENIDYIKDFAHNLGIDYGEELYESAAIGGFDGVNPLQMSAAYSAFARGGYYIEPYSVTKVVYDDEEETFKYKPNKVMSEETAYMITDILISGAKSGVGGITMGGVDIAAKGGTTTIDKASTKLLNIPGNATQDAWNITYDPKYTIALWMGYDKTTAEHYMTSNFSSPIRNRIMKAVASRIYKKSDGTFKRPSGVVSSKVEMETYPAQLPSEYTPGNLVLTELFKEGYEPTEVSTRFSKLDNPTSVNASASGNTITISWNAIKTPDAIDNNYLSDYFNKYFEDRASNHYEKRLDYNRKNIGTLQYQIYLEKNGTETLIGTTAGTSYTYTASESGNLKFIVKAAYSIFKANMSSGASASVNIVGETNIINDNQSENNNSNNNNNDNSYDNDTNGL